MLTVLKSQDRNRVEEVRAADLFREKQKLTQNQNYPLLRLMTIITIIMIIINIIIMINVQHPV